MREKIKILTVFLGPNDHPHWDTDCKQNHASNHFPIASRGVQFSKCLTERCSIQYFLFMRGYFLPITQFFYTNCCNFCVILLKKYIKNTDLINCSWKYHVSWIQIQNGYKLYFNMTKSGILLPKLFWPTVRKTFFSDREFFLKFKAEGWEFAIFFRSLEQFIQTVGQNNFGNKIPFIVFTLQFYLSPRTEQRFRT